LFLFFLWAEWAIFLSSLIHCYLTL
jgi:hypothetical protein